MNIQQLFEQRKRPCVYVEMEGTFDVDRTPTDVISNLVIKRAESYSAFKKDFSLTYSDEYYGYEPNKIEDALENFDCFFPLDLNLTAVSKFRKIAARSLYIWQGIIPNYGDENEWSAVMIAVLRK